MFNFYGFDQLAQQKAFQNLLNIAGINFEQQNYQHKILPSNTNQKLIQDILAIVQAVQEKFVIRKAFQERWEVSLSNPILENQNFNFDHLRTLGFIEEIKPSIRQVDCVCVLGGIRASMVRRINYVNSLIKSGLQTKDIILLTGERSISQNIDGTLQELTSIAYEMNISDWNNLTETHLMQYIYNNSELKKLNLPLHVIDTPKLDLPRANTQTTIMALIKWLKKYKDAKNLIFISNQPYVKYQEAVIRTIFTKQRIDIKFEVTGPEVLEKQNIQQILEAFGSYIWAATPLMLKTMNLKIKNKTISDALNKLYSSSPLIYSLLPINLR